MPPLERIDPLEGHIVPCPNDILILGDNRWLSATGQILSSEFGNPVGLKLNTLKFWEAAALRGTGQPLSELFAWLGQGKHDSARVRELELLEELSYDAEADEQASPDLVANLKRRIDELKTDLVIELGRGGIDHVG